MGAIISSTVITLSTAGMLCIYVGTLEREMTSELDQIKKDTDSLWRDMVSMDQNLEATRRARRDLEEVLDVTEAEAVFPDQGRVTQIPVLLSRCSKSHILPKLLFGTKYCTKYAFTLTRLTNFVQKFTSNILGREDSVNRIIDLLR
ncbi:unnamed protein product [Cylicostephanus goldi]|uniref:Nematode cuticle collagen N-terminal domain-containing protein n=1 Tax=Cylicostephanus goldi TaxID=71465 RepID=A0A3P7P0M2_CYLGO|nr:unnamed protein product [Cylicostephanus goldi]